jgi:pyruvate dehydrogenase E1 component beta subunit
MARDERVFCIGEDIAIPGGWGGAFTVTLGLEKDFPDRMLNTPIAENGFMGVACGAAMMGLRPIADVQYSDFLFCAMDQVCNNVAKMRYMSGGKATVPMVIRAPVGVTGRGSQHAQNMETFFMPLQGVKMVDGSSDIPDEDYTVPLGKAVVRKEGTDVTIIGTLLMMHRALQAAEQLANEGINAEVIDPRSLVPFDWETVRGSVQKTGKVIVVEESPKRGGIGAEIVATIAEEMAFDLDAAPVRVTAPNTVVPFSPPMEKFYIPQVYDIVNAVEELTP